LGIIEAGLPLLNTTSDDPQALGQPDDFEFRIDSSNHEGELCLKGPGMFDAYLSPWRLREEVMQDGWFRTGDLARLNGDGNVRLVGRLKSVINVGGSKCYPEEIEEVLRSHNAIADVRVFGRPHERWGMLPVAEIVLNDPQGAPPSASNLTKFCRARLAPYKVPVSFITVDALPMTSTGKVRRA
jgi:long-chain acyl-CoA synthetase